MYKLAINFNALNIFSESIHLDKKLSNYYEL